MLRLRRRLPMQAGGPNLRVLVSPLASGDNGNPYVDLLYSAVRAEGDVVLVDFSRRRLLGKWDIVHFHWPEWNVRSDTNAHTLYDASIFLALLTIASLRGARVAWTAHDMGPHDTEDGIYDLFFRLFIRHVRLVFGLSHQTLDAVVKRYPALQAAQRVVVPHGHYRDAYAGPSPDKTTARHQLHIDDCRRILILIGQIRRYKNFDTFVRLFRASAASDDRLIVAGQPQDDALRGAVVAAAAGDPRVMLHLSEIPHDLVPVFIRAADTVVLPYRAILNSGVALLALSLDRPVVVPSLGGLGELAAEFGDDWVQTYDLPLTAEVVTAALALPPPSGRPTMEGRSWPQIGRRTVGAYRLSAGRSA